MNIRDRVISLVTKSGMSQKDFAKAISAPVSTVNGWFKQENRNPSAEYIIPICELFSVSCIWLLTGKNESLSNTSKNNNEISTTYETLDMYGKEAVKAVLNIECSRCQSIKNTVERKRMYKIRHNIYKVSAGTGFILDDNSVWEDIEIPDTPEARRADFALTIKGDSMEPIYNDGDIILVKETDEIELGDVGIFIVNESGYIKKYAGDKLISLNAAYKDIKFHASDEINCVGQVIGRV